MAGSPWCSSLTVYWAPAFSFYDHRSKILKTLADEGALRAWKVREQFVGARLAGHHELLVRTDAFSLACFDSLVDPHVLAHATSAVVSALAPQVDGATLSVQHLEPLPGEYDAVAAGATRALLGELAATASATDFSLLLSGSMGEESEYRAEFGIVTPDEAESRLARAVGQLAELEAPHSPPPDLEVRELPPVALYMDTRWHSDALTSMSNGEVETFVEQAEQTAAALVDGVLARLPLGHETEARAIGAAQ